MTEAQRFYHVTRASVRRDSWTALEVGLMLRRLVLGQKISEALNDVKILYLRTNSISSVPRIAIERLHELQTQKRSLGRELDQMRDWTLFRSYTKTGSEGPSELLEAPCADR